MQLDNSAAVYIPDISNSQQISRDVMQHHWIH